VGSWWKAVLLHNRRQDWRTPNQGSRWSTEDDAHLTSRWEQGADVGQLPEEFGPGAGGITARLVRLGLVEDRQEARRRQGSLDPAAQQAVPEPKPEDCRRVMPMSVDDDFKRPKGQSLRAANSGGLEAGT